MDTLPDDWFKGIKATLDWFIDTIGVDQWHRRRKQVVDYFRSLKLPPSERSGVNQPPTGQPFDPIAYYKDWMAWYMYLMESVFERPGCDDPFQSNRVYPFFAIIGRNIEALKKMPGIDTKIRTLLNERQNKPDSSLYELAVATLYHRNGWKVEFLKEVLTGKTPDLQISKDGLTFWVECKRMAKVSDYAEKERQEWQKRYAYLTALMEVTKIPVFVEVTFKVPIDHLDENILAVTYMNYIKAGQLTSGKEISTAEIDFKATRLDLQKINAILADWATRPHSPQMIQIITGHYDMHGNYTQTIAPSITETIAPDNELFVLNEFWAGLHAVYMAKWESLSEESLDKKGRDIKKKLSEAVSQIPDKGPGIIHIGYETVTGPAVEIAREKKIFDTVKSFTYSPKDIEAVYCNAMQMFPTIAGFEWAETTSFFERNPGQILTKTLVLDTTETTARNTTHWEEDMQNRKG